MSHERDGLEAGVPGREDCLRHDYNNPKRPKLSGDDPDECAGDSSGKDKTQIAKQIQHFAGLFGGNGPVSGSGFTADLNCGANLCHKRFISN